MRAMQHTGGAAAAFALAVLTLAACGSGATHPAPATPRAVPVRASATVTPGPLPTQLPDAFIREASHPDPNFDFGVVIQITLSGFQPAEMVAPCCQQRIVWQNLTNAPQSIEMDAFDVNSGPIAPGASYMYQPRTAVSLAYHSVANPNQTGLVDLTSTQEP